MKISRIGCSQLAITGNPNLSTPWGRYRHGCDPPETRAQWTTPDSSWISLLSSSGQCVHLFLFSFFPPKDYPVLHSYRNSYTPPEAWHRSPQPLGPEPMEVSEGRIITPKLSTTPSVQYRHFPVQNDQPVR